MIECYIDDREQKRGHRALKYFLEQGYPTKITELTYGDFVFEQKGFNKEHLKLAFEYKTIEDYIASINDNRVFNQALNQSNNYNYHFVIVVGTDKEKQELIREKQTYTGNYITNEQFYGAYASLVNITSLIQVPNEKTAFLVMDKVAQKCLTDKPVLKRFNKSRGTPALRLLTNTVNRVGYKTAERICNELDLVTVDDVLGDNGLNILKLQTVKGVGEKTAENILSQLFREFK